MSTSATATSLTCGLAVSESMSDLAIPAAPKLAWYSVSLGAAVACDFITNGKAKPALAQRLERGSAGQSGFSSMTSGWSCRGRRSMRLDGQVLPDRAMRWAQSASSVTRMITDVRSGCFRFVREFLGWLSPNPPASQLRDHGDADGRINQPRPCRRRRACAAVTICAYGVANPN